MIMSYIDLTSLLPQEIQGLLFLRYGWQTVDWEKQYFVKTHNSGTCPPLSHESPRIEGKTKFGLRFYSTARKQA